MAPPLARTAPTASATTLALSILALAALAGCAASSTDDSSESAAASNASASNESAAQPANESVATIDHAAWSTMGYRLDWQGFPFAGIVESPRVTRLSPQANYVLVQEKGSFVSLLEADNGARRWTAQLGSDTTKFVGLDADPADPQRVFVSSESELFSLAAANGNIIGRERFARVVDTAPTFIDGVAVYGSASGEVLAHRPGGAIKAWSFGAHSPVYNNPVRMNESVGVLTHEGHIYIFSGGGTLQGHAKILGNATTHPVTNGTHLVVAGRDQSLWCFDDRANETWRIRQSQPLTVQPTAVGTGADAAVVCDLPDLGLSSIDFGTGDIRWSNKKASGTIIASNKGRLLLWDGTTASLIDAARGDILASTTLPGITKITTDQFEGGNLYAATAEGSVAKLRLKN